MALNKNKKILIVVGAILFAIGLICGLIFGLKSKKTKIAIYGLDEKLAEKIEQYVKKSLEKSNVTIIPLEEKLTVSDAKKYDAIFTWSGAESESFSKVAKEIPADLYSQMPSAVRKSSLVNGKRMYLPILFEHVPLYYCRKAKSYDDQVMPESLMDLEKNLEEEKSDFTFSFLCAGANDKDFFDFLSLMSESVLGGDCYKNLIEKIKEKKNFRDVLDENLGKLSDGSSYSLRTVMDKIFSWQKNGTIQTQWYQISENDLIALMQYQEFCSATMELSFYRALPRRIGYEYGVIKFPALDKNAAQGLIADELVMMALNQNKSLKKLEEDFVSTGIQEQLSNVTTLSPVHSQAGSYDIIADDARFYSAATQLGPLPTLDKAAFVSSESCEAFAKDAREYLVLGL